jgi:hypothetical protein
MKIKIHLRSKLPRSTNIVLLASFATNVFVSFMVIKYFL